MPTIGIFGGGQVAKMLAQAASTLSVEMIIFAQHEDEPALQVTSRRIIGQWDDEALLSQFAAECDVITIDNAAVPAEILRHVEELGTPVYPSPATIEQIQDQLMQKRHMQGEGISVPRFKQVLAGSDVLEASTEFGFPLMLKTRKPEEGIPAAAMIRRAHDIEPALQRFRGRKLMAEEVVKSVRELAVIVARGQDGDIRAYPVVEIVRKNGVCHIVRCPAPVEEAAAFRATEMAINAVKSIDGVGVFGVDVYEIEGEEIIFHEITPHPHDGGHYSIEGTITSQFENHIRAILGWPLGDVAQIAPATVMINILGERKGEPNPLALKDALEVGGVHWHLYGKSEIIPGRKMGHITVLGYNIDGAEKVGLLALSKFNL